MSNQAAARMALAIEDELGVELDGSTMLRFEAEAAQYEQLTDLELAALYQAKHETGEHRVMYIVVEHLAPERLHVLDDVDGAIVGESPDTRARRMAIGAALRMVRARTRRDRDAAQLEFDYINASGQRAAVIDALTSLVSATAGMAPEATDVAIRMVMRYARPQAASDE